VKRRTGVGLLLIVAAGVALRLIPSPRIFGVAYVNFQGDGWYHLRRLDWHLANFPSTLTMDPYVGNVHIPLPPLFDWLLSFFVALAGWPAPGSYEADAAAAVAPAILGGLIAIPVFFLARALFSAEAGWFAAFLAAVLPGPFLVRSMVGVSDHHVAEALFTTMTLAFLISALARANDGRSFTRVAVLASLAGAALGAYFLVWSGAAFIVPALIAGLALESIAGLVRAKWNERHAVAFAICGAVALAIVTLVQPRSLYRVDLQFLSLKMLIGSAALAWIVLAAARRIGSPRKIAAAIGIAVLLGVAGIVARGDFGPFADDLNRVFRGGNSTVGETRPLFALGLSAWATIQGVYGPSFAALIALPWLVLRVVRGVPGAGVFTAWVLLTFAATLGQNRFGYYLAINLAVLLGLVLSSIRTRAPFGRRIAPVLCLSLLAASAQAYRLALLNDEGAPVEWHQAMSWLRRMTPEPFGEPGTYFASPSDAATSRVLSWWDYGYLIARIGRRVPLSNPTQAFADVSGRLLTNGPAEGADTEATFRELKIRTVIVSEDMVFRMVNGDPYGKYGTMLSWSGRQESDHYVAAMQKAPDGSDRRVWFFRPAYFRSLAVHLFRYGGRAVRADDVRVITLAADPDGRSRVVAERVFPSFPEAQTYQRSLPPGKHLIVSNDPSRTCVDLEARPGFESAFDADGGGTADVPKPKVRVFRYTAAF